VILHCASYCSGDARQIPRPAGESAGLRDDAEKNLMGDVLQDMRMKKLILTSIAFTLLATASRAQDTPKADVAVAYSPLYILKGYTIWMNGGSSSVAVRANDWFGVARDFGAYVGHIPQSFTGETYLAGPRFSYRKLDRIVPFAQALFGGSHFSTSTGGITGGGSQFTFALGGGGDLELGSSRKFALRLGLDYFGIRSSGATTPSARIYAGIVYRVGKK
jgi:hypothetical protein